MSKYLFLFMLLVYGSIAHAQNKIDTSHNVIWTDAHFGKSSRDWQKYIAKNLRIPKGEVQNGQVILVFTVEKDGSLNNIRVIRSPDDSCSKSAVKLLQKSPKWAPGIRNNVPVRSGFTVPVPCYCTINK